MAGEAFQLAILLTLKDAASGGLDRFAARLRAAGKDGEKFASDFEKIRSQMNKDLAIGGMGIAGLDLMRRGVQVAGDFQSSMTELRSSFSQLGRDGKVDLAKLGPEMQRAEGVAIRLGNALPGTTEDFVQMMQVLKQNGLSVETILNGAADAVGNLAVATKSVPREIAADFAQFGNLFKLRAQDFTPAADVFARIYSSTGQTSSELVEAAKYFQGRAGKDLGIGGLKDAEQWARVFGMMGKEGMRGSMAGMSLTNFFTAYTAHRDKLDDLAKATGIKLEFFDSAGKFVGIDNLIEQMSQFNRLTPKDRSEWMETMFGTLGSGAANILANADAWKAFNAEQNKAISLQQKTAEMSKDFNNQVEALTGSLKNLVVTSLSPLLPELTQAAKSANELVGGLVEFGKANPGLTKTLGTLAMYGSMAMVAYSGIRTLTGGLRMLKLASAVSKGDLSFFTQVAGGAERAATRVETFHTGASSSARKTSRSYADMGRNLAVVQKQAGGAQGGLARFARETKIAQNETRYAAGGLQRFSDGFAAVGSKAEASQAKVGRFSGAIGSFARSWAGQSILLTIGLVVGSNVISQLQELAEHEARVRGLADELNKLYEDMAGRGELYSKTGTNRDQKDQLAGKFLESLSRGGELEQSLRPAKNWWEHINRKHAAPFGLSEPTDQSPSWMTGRPLFDPDQVARVLSADKTGAALRDVDVLARVLAGLNKELPGGTTLSGNEVERVVQALEKMVGKDKMDLAKSIVADELGRQQKKPEAPTSTRPAPTVWGLVTRSDFRVGQPQATRDLLGLSQPSMVRPFDPMRPGQYSPYGSLYSPPSQFTIQPFQTRDKPPVDTQPRQQPYQDIKPFPMPAMPPVDLAKIADVSKVSDVLNSLNQPVASNVESFGLLHPQVTPNVTTFQHLVQPTTETGQAFGNLLDPSRQLPGSFGRINSSAARVAGGLDMLSSTFANYRLPTIQVSGVAVGPGGQVVAQPGPSNAVGGFVSGSGVGYIHFDEEIVPARVRAFRDTLGQNLVAGLTEIRQQRSFDARRFADNRSSFVSNEIMTQIASMTDAGTRNRLIAEISNIRGGDVFSEGDRRRSVIGDTYAEGSRSAITNILDRSNQFGPVSNLFPGADDGVHALQQSPFGSIDNRTFNLAGAYPGVSNAVFPQRTMGVTAFDAASGRRSPDATSGLGAFPPVESLRRLNYPPTGLYEAPAATRGGVATRETFERERFGIESLVNMITDVRSRESERRYELAMLTRDATSERTNDRRTERSQTSGPLTVNVYQTINLTQGNAEQQRTGRPSLPPDFAAEIRKHGKLIGSVVADEMERGGRRS